MGGHFSCMGGVSRAGPSKGCGRTEPDHRSSVVRFRGRGPCGQWVTEVMRPGAGGMAGLSAVVVLRWSTSASSSVTSPPCRVVISPKTVKPCRRWPGTRSGPSCTWRPGPPAFRRPVRCPRGGGRHRSGSCRRTLPAATWASVMKLPSGVSGRGEPRPGMSAEMWPTTRFATSSERACQASISLAMAGCCGVPTGTGRNSAPYGAAHHLPGGVEVEARVGESLIASRDRIGLTAHGEFLASERGRQRLSVSSVVLMTIHILCSWSRRTPSRRAQTA
ncbi:hypothetical protein GA0115234_108176 [Streptomyces sp. DvalAA-43]|nr:hypothetical protein GA0115234_108176 [Streptomyces sp. DvalAA-43]